MSLESKDIEADTTITSTNEPENSTHQEGQTGKTDKGKQFFINLIS